MSLQSLSDKQILFRIHRLTRCERGLTLRVLLHLNEIDRRRLHLSLGYSSMFDYSTSGLGYSSSAAWRRIQSARCVARFPEIFGMLESNEASLCTVAKISRVLSAANKDQLLERIRGKSQREVEGIVAEFEPRPMPRDVIRPIVTARLAPASDKALPNALCAAAAVAEPRPVAESPDACEKSAYCRSGSAADTRAVLDTRAEGPACQAERDAAAHVEHRLMVRFCASEAFLAKLEKIKSLAWHRLPANAPLEQVFELAMDAFLEREDPRERQERRDKRADRSGRSEQPAVQDSTEQEPKTATPVRAQRPASPARYITASVRDRVFVRDEGRCSFVGANGRRCASTHALQLDHVHPVARGGRGTVENLRLLCAGHNRLEAERLMGVAAGAPSSIGPGKRAAGRERPRARPLPR